MDVVDRGRLAGAGKATKYRNHGESAMIRGRGMRIAPFLRGLALAMTCCLPLTGCLVTDPVDFEEERNFPASIESPTGMDVQHPLNEVIVLDEADTLGAEELVLDVLVRDPNVDQTLQWKLFVDNRDTDSKRGQFLPDGPDDEPRQIRRRQLTLPQMLFTEAGCHRIELRVTESFGFANPQEPRPLPDGGIPAMKDLGTARWWVFTRDAPEATFDPVLCPSM